MEHILPCLDIEQPSKFAAVQPFLRIPVERHEAILIVDAQQQIFPAGDFNDAIGLFDIRHERLFAENVRAGLHCFTANLEVRTGWRSDNDNVGRDARQHFIERGKGPLHADLRTGGTRAFARIAAPGNFDFLDRVACGKVYPMRDAAEPGYADSNTHAFNASIRSVALPAPELSVVVAVVSGCEPALHCVRGIEREAAGLAIEIIVVHSGSCDYGPAVTVVRVPPPCSEHQMRLIGRRVAKADKVAVVGDRYEVQPGWMQAAIATGPGGIVGCIDAPATLSAVGWAIYLAEYSHVAAPMPAASASMPMGNVVYRNGAGRFRHDPGLLVTFARPPRLMEYVAQRFDSSRAWAEENSRDWNGSRRILGALSRFALPALLLWRRSRNVFFRRRHRARLLLALPYLLVFGVIEAAGEMAGFVLHPYRPECTPRF
jgi:hypothetical protein